MRKDRFAKRAKNLSPAMPHAHFPTEFGPEVILFDSGFAAPELLPDLSDFAVLALTAYREETLQYSPRQGQPELRKWLCQLMNEDGCTIGPENILITNGAKNGLDLICRMLLDEGDAIVVTAPTYFTAIPIFRNFGVEFVEVEQDNNGLDVAQLEDIFAKRKADNLPVPKFIYNIPEFHNPTGRTMSEQRRRELVKFAAREHVYIVEDSPYRRVRFDGESRASLKSLDHEGWVFHVGTFSKLVAPGLRIGWIVADEALIARLIQLKFDGGSSPLIQRILYEFLQSPVFGDHVERVRVCYRERRDRIAAAIARELPEVTLSVPEGGYYVWLTLPTDIDGDALASYAADVGINLLAGSKFFALPDDFDPAKQARRNHIRLSYSYATPDRIDEGIIRLAQAYRLVAIR